MYEQIDVTPLDDPRDSPVRRRILSTVAGLFAENGFHAVGLAQIEKATGLTRGALYHHFSSKEELLYDISSRYIVALVASGQKRLELDQSATNRVTSLSRDFIQAVFTSSAEMTVCFREFSSLTGDRRRYVTDKHREYEDVWGQCVSDGIADGTFRAVDRLELKALLGMYFYSFLWLRLDGPESHLQVADRFAALAFRALSA